MPCPQADSEDKEDLMKYFLEDYRSPNPKSFSNRNILYADSSATMIGGTDTIACVLSYAFYYLARDASLRGRLREEIAPLFGASVLGEFASADLGRAELLGAVIDETMRMHNPTCNNGARTVPPDGITVDGTFIPGKVTVFTGIHAFHRSEPNQSPLHSQTPRYCGEEDRPVSMNPGRELTSQKC